jgi:hypothetical protein
MKSKIIAKDDKHLEKIIRKEMKRNGVKCSLNHIDVSQVTNMAGLFIESDFDGDISEWDVSNVYNMAAMFAGSKFTGNLSKWEPYNLILDGAMFKNCSAPHPYWFNLTEDERKKQIDYYRAKKQITKELGEELEINSKGNNEKRTKI